MRWFVVLLLLLLPGAVAWNWDTHEAFVDMVYYGLEEDVREQLDPRLMEEGSILPDKEFQDFQRHSFPLSVGETEKWLQRTREALARDDYGNASLAFGVASHYITDSFSAPHAVKGETYELHRAYEDQASEAYLYVPCSEERVKIGDVLYTGAQQGKTWEQWVETRDPMIPRQAVREAGVFLFSIAMETFESRCHSFQTDVEEERLSLGWKEMLFGVLILGALGWVGVSLYRDLKQH